MVAVEIRHSKKTRRAILIRAVRNGDVSTGMPYQGSCSCSKLVYSSGWSPCSVTCGQGTQKRTRRCMIEAPNTPTGYASQEKNETQPCTGKQPSCATWQEWAPWSEVSMSNFQDRGRYENLALSVLNQLWWRHSNSRAPLHNSRPMSRKRYRNEKLQYAAMCRMGSLGT